MLTKGLERPGLITGLMTVLIAGLLAWPVYGEQHQAGDHSEATVEDHSTVQDSVEQEADRQLDRKREKLVADAVTALDETEKALGALKDGETDKPLDSLALATGKLELIIARDPDLALAPVAVDLITRDVLGDLKTIRATRETIEDLVDDGKIQEARPLMRNFGSELVIETTNLPLATYPEAIKVATAMIDDGDVDGAIATLETALTTLIVSDSAIPLPILRAETFIEEARAALQTDREGDGAAEGDRDIARSPEDYIDAARHELEVAEALGYGADEDYADLRDTLEHLEDKIARDQETGGLFATIAEKLSALRDRIFGNDGEEA